MTEPTYFVAWCWACEMVLPFRDKAERDEWTEGHRRATAHVVVTGSR